MSSKTLTGAIVGLMLGSFAGYLVFHELRTSTQPNPTTPVVIPEPEPSPAPVREEVVTTTAPTLPPNATTSTTHDGEGTHTEVITAPLELSTSTLSVTPSSTTNTQYVVLAFDGSRSLDMWKQTRALSQDLAKQGILLHFTYFINTVYLLAYQHRDFYHPPQHATGTSPIGFATTEKDVADRLEQMNTAISEGHEIGSHAMGHYNGSTWTEADWLQEFRSFFDTIEQVATINHLNKEPLNRQKLLLPSDGMVGFRAPELGMNDHIWPILKQFHFLYDTSFTSKPNVWPAKLKSGFWEFPLEKIAFNGSTTSSLLSMDYNFYFKQSKAVDVAKKGTPLWDQYYNEVLTSYRQYFSQSYEGNRAPIFIGHHFSLWNDGVYWEAMKTFAQETCGKPNVQCVSYKEVMEALNAR